MPGNTIERIRFDSLPAPDSHEIKKRLLLERMLAIFEPQFRESAEEISLGLENDFNEELRQEEKEQFSEDELKQILRRVRDAAITASVQGFYKPTSR